MPADPRDYKLEIGSDRPDPPPTHLTGRAFVSVYFRCCRVYQRIYKSRCGLKYEGRCPKCLAVVRLRVGPDGTDARAFVAE